MKSVTQLLLYARTIQMLMPSQMAYFAMRRILPSPTVPRPPSPAAIRSGIAMQDTYPYRTDTGQEFTFNFLNHQKTFNQHSLDWSCPGMSKLWKYNLHYFDYLHDPSRSIDNKSSLITSWITTNAYGTEDAWAPYPLSLRIVNWIKFFLKKDSSIEAAWNDSLYHQTLCLEQNIEYHIRANHYLKNGVALLFSGLYFQGPKADEWFHMGVRIISKELEEQFLVDGGHFERSPMYHCICVLDYLDSFNILMTSTNQPDFVNTTRMKARMTTALDFLFDISFPDGNISLFNDSALNITPTPSSVFDYAHTLFGYVPPKICSSTYVKVKPDSGYYIVGNQNDQMIIDCGDIGPRYQPGHAHCDTLSYELSINGNRVIVDSGVYDYESGLTRQYARSTKAHNTVAVDGEEQSEVWGLFRVARRAKPLDATLSRSESGDIIFQGAHTGYKRLPGQVIHHRQIIYDGQSTWRILDEIQGKLSHSIESYIHLHPAYSAYLDHGIVRVTDPAGALILSIQTSHPDNMRIEKCWYFPGFGVKEENLLLIFSCSGELPLSMDYRIRKEVKSMPDDRSSDTYPSLMSYSLE